MKKFAFAFCLIISALLALNSYAQFDLEDLMEPDTPTVEDTTDSVTTKDTAKDTSTKKEADAKEDTAKDLEKSLDDLFADDLNSVFDEEKTEESASGDENAKENVEDSAEVKAEESPQPETAATNDEPLEAEETSETNDTSATEIATETETNAEDNTEADKEKNATETPDFDNVAQDTDYDIFADDEVEDLFDESTTTPTEEQSEPQEAEDVLPINSENANPVAQDDFMDDYFEDLEEQKQKDATAYKAQKDALRLISDDPQVVTLKDEQRLSLREANQKRKEMEQQLKSAKAKQPPLAKPAAYIPEKSNTDEDATIATDKAEESAETQSAESPAAPETNFSAEAPFGLRWNAGKEEIEAMGFATTPAELGNYQGVYVVRNPQQPQKIFTLVTAIFGTGNHLQAIYAQSLAKEDTPQAERVLKLYHQYYEALEKKYGNAKEHFVPNTQGSDMPQKEETEAAEPEAEENTQAQPAEKTTPADNSIGNDNFLNELKEEKAALFATFSDDNINVTLTVLADENGKTYITLDYENKYVVQKEQNANFDALLNDL